MPFCGFIKVQPDGLKEKAAKSLQKWDPVSKRMITITPQRYFAVKNVNITRVGLTESLSVTWGIDDSWCYFEPYKATVDIYQSTTQNTISGTKIQSIQTTSNSYIVTPPTRDFYYYAIVTSENSNSSVSNSVAYGDIINTIAGTGTSGSGGDGGYALSARLSSPYGVSLDSAGNIYIADTGNSSIRKVTVSTGIITTVAGTGTSGFDGDGGSALSAQLHGPRGVSLDSAGNIYIVDTLNRRIRKVTVSTGIITTVAGTGTAGSEGDEGLALDAQLGFTSGISLDSAGNIYIADSSNNRIRKVTVSTGIITTVAGTGTSGSGGDGGYALSAELRAPTGVSLDSAGNIYIADTGNSSIRKVTVSTGIITTVAGTGTSGFDGDGGSALSAQLRAPSGVSFDSAGNIYIADSNNHRIRKVTVLTGIITTVAGTGTAGSEGDEGYALSAQLRDPTGLSLDSVGNIYIADRDNHRIRKVNVS